MRDIADVRLELKDLLAESSPARPMVRRPRRKAVAATLVLGALATLGVWLLRSKAPPADVRMPRFQLSLPRGIRIQEANALAISPDGSQVAFHGFFPDSTGASQLWVRDRSAIDARPLPGTEDGDYPFYSPDGRWIAFTARGQLKKVNLETGAVLVLAEGLNVRGGSWGEEGTILVGRFGGGLVRVSPDGGEVLEVTTPDADRKEFAHYWPHVLPGGGAALFDVVNFDEASQNAGSRGHDVAVVDLETGTKRILVERAGCPRYLDGHLLFGRDGIVYAAPLDLERRELRATPFPVLEGVSMWSSPGLTGFAQGAVNYGISKNGDLMFSPREASLPQRTLVLVDREGRRRPASTSRRAYMSGAYFSPDGRRIAVSILTSVGDRGAFVLDLGSEAWIRLGGEESWSSMAWAPDGKSLFLYDVSSEARIVLAPVNESAVPETVYVGPAGDATVTPDGSALLVSVQGRIWDIWRVPLNAAGPPDAWLATPLNEGFASASPDGRWVAFKSNDSGREEIYVRAYAGSGGRYQVSTQGGNFPRWSRDGKEIFFTGPDDKSLWAAAVRTSPSFASDPPRKLFDYSDDLLNQARFDFDVSPDGQDFLMIEKDPIELRPVELVIVPGWVEEMKARVAAAK